MVFDLHNSCSNVHTILDSCSFVRIELDNC